MSYLAIRVGDDKVYESYWTDNNLCGSHYFRDASYVTRFSALLF